MKNPFIVGKTVPPQFFEAYNYDDWKDCPTYLSNDDFLRYGLRGDIVETSNDAERLHNQYLQYLKEKSNILAKK